MLGQAVAPARRVARLGERATRQDVVDENEQYSQLVAVLGEELGVQVSVVPEHRVADCAAEAAREAFRQDLRLEPTEVDPVDAVRGEWTI